MRGTLSLGQEAGFLQQLSLCAYVCECDTPNCHVSIHLKCSFPTPGQVPLPRLGSSLWVGLFHPGLTLRIHGAQIQLKSQVPHQLACVLGQSTLLLGLLTESPERAPARSPEH